jgi:N-acetylglucosamine kinase-like BadF-type ATPase
MDEHRTEGYLLALEAGGSKTECVVLSPDDQVVAYGRGGPTNTIFISLETAEESIRTAVGTAFSQLNGVPRVFEVFALSAMAPTEIVFKVVLETAQVGRTVHYGEHQVALASAGCYELEGIAVIAGTGSSITGWHHGRSHHVGGWGANLGDEGSAYDIGLRGLKAAIQASDGRGPQTVLQERVMQHFGLRHLRELVPRVHLNPTARPDVAGFAPVVMQAAVEGDAAAQAIARHAARELSWGVLVVARRLYCPQESFQVVLAGGVFKAGEVLIAPFREAVVAEFPHAQICPARFRPAEALARLARYHQRREGREASPPVPAHLKSQGWNHDRSVFRAVAGETDGAGNGRA